MTKEAKRASGGAARWMTAALLLCLAAFPAFPAVEVVGNHEMPVILSACTSNPRTQEDEEVLDAVDKMIIETGNYVVIKTDVTFDPNDTPTVEDFNAEDRARNVYYVLTGGRTPGEGSTTYNVSVYNIKTGDLLGSDQFNYSTVDEVSINGLMVISRLFFLVPVPKELDDPENNIWKTSLLYLTGEAGGTFGRWNTTVEDKPGVHPYDGWSGSGGIGAEFQFTALRKDLWLAAAAQINFTMDMVKYKDPEEGFSLYKIEVPLMLKLNWYPSHFLLSVFGGIYLFQPFAAQGTLNGTSFPPLGYIAGIEGGMKAGSGALTFFFGFSQDLADTYYQHESLGEITYRKMVGTVGVTYKLVAIKTPQKRIDAFSGGW